ncbi:sensor domain-containing diguanylate cyclase [Megalodesulfovibrio gigas]|nr:sensor domain-containing diguanylate cyclase [Megalodesulfovibrio gigas]
MDILSAPKPLHAMRVLLQGNTIKSRLRLLSLALILLPPTLGLGFFAVYALSYLKDRAYETLHHVLEYDKGFIERWMEERQRDVAFLATLPVVERQDFPAMRHVFAQYAATHDDVTGVVFLDADGFNMVDTGSDKRINAKDRDYFRAGMQGRAFVSDILIGRTSGKPILIVSAPVAIAGEFKGVVMTPVRMTTVDALLRTLRVGRHGSVALLDSHGAWHVGQEDAQNATFFLKDDLQRALTKAGAVATTNARGEQALGAALALNNDTWVLAGQLPLSEVLTEYSAFLLTALAGGLLTLAVITPFLLRLIRSLERPMHQLAEMAKDMATGQFASVCPFPGTRETSLWEVRTLTEAFCRMQEMVGESMETLKRVAITDQLTGLFNRRHLLAEGARIVDVCLRGGAPCACIMADVDHFKRINDTWGHKVGDDALRQVADTLRYICRGSDIVARFGGEEFVVLAPNAGLAQGAELAERLRLAIADASLYVDDTRVPMTMSFGVAECLLESLDTVAAHGPGSIDLVLQDALRRADMALYRAKQTGRNRVVSDDEG